MVNILIKGWWGQAGTAIAKLKAWGATCVSTHIYTQPQSSARWMDANFIFAKFWLIINFHYLFDRCILCMKDFLIWIILQLYNWRLWEILTCSTITHIQSKIPGAIRITSKLYRMRKLTYFISLYFRSKWIYI